MTQTMSQGELAGILRARAVAISEAQLEAALRDAESGPQLATWASTHLTDDTLLTLDELELYDALQRSGRDEQLLANSRNKSDGTSPAATLPLREIELRAALAALERSTATINKQTDVLRQQQDAVAKLAVPLKSSSQSQDGNAAAHHQKRWDAARADLVAGVERSARDLEERVGDLSLQNRALAQRVQQTVDGLCRSDDTLLASLQKLGWALPAVPRGAGNAGDEHERQQQRSISRLRDICLHLIKFGVETIRTRLDRLYLEALEEEAASNEEAEEDAVAVAALQAELESLYAEILPVAQMSVEQQHLEPALRSLWGQNTKNLTRALLALDYMDDCLAYLLEHVALLAARIDTAAAHHATTETMIATARTELAVPVATAASSSSAAAAARRAQNEQRRRLSNYGSPVRRRQSGASGSGGGGIGGIGGMSAHLRTRSGTVGGSSSMVSATDIKAQRRRSSGFGYDGFGAGAGGSAGPMDQLLEGLSLLLPMEEPAAGENASPAAVATATRANARFLQTTLADRASKADGVASNAQEAFEAATTTSLTDARRALELARASVLAESPFGDVRLVDAEIDGSMAVVADEVAHLRERRAAIEAGLGQAKKMRSSKREQMVARWA
ncbi:hypothetical protein SCUCBS95973_003326 [Sporothrix curviconia]|uniref:Uncharacterized protein n=1 Tax=Sporothrix curviconia TaxID=1260050 RepID=A0ABP0BFK8_9PEZI